MLAIHHRRPTLWSTLTILAAVGCGGGGEAEADSAPEAASGDAMTVQITEPAEGATVDGASVRVVFEVDNLDIVPAGTMDAGTGHHHLIVNADLTPEGQPIPATDGTYIHFGAAQTETELTDLAPGPYTLIAVVADGVHIPLQPWVVDTVRFTVR